MSATIDIHDFKVGSIVSYRITELITGDNYQFIVSEIVSITTIKDREMKDLASPRFSSPQYDSINVIALDTKSLDRIYVSIEMFKSSGNMYIRRHKYTGEIPILVPPSSREHVESKLTFDMKILQ